MPREQGSGGALRLRSGQAEEQVSSEEDWDVEVVYTGLGPGEKLCEELFREGERVGVTKHEQIFIAEADDFDGERLREGVVELERLAL